MSIYVDSPLEEKERILPGLLGAFLFSLVGGVAWFIFYFFGFFSALSGVLGVLCAIKGYSLFAKKESIKGIVFSVIIVFAVLTATWYACIGFDLLQAFQSEYSQGNILFVPSFTECLNLVPELLRDPEYGSGYFTDLLCGLALAFLGSIGSIIEKVKKTKNVKQETEAAKEQESESFHFESK